MAKMQIDAILWRKYLAATSHAIWEVSTSQYYFELTPSNYEIFLGPGAKTFTDKDGNAAYSIVLEAFDGKPAVGRHEITFTKKRPSAAREGKWTADSIRDGSKAAYDLWRRDRGPVQQYEQLPLTEKEKNFIIVVRDVSGQFHGRWIRGTDFDALPLRLQEVLLSGTSGWREL